MPAIRAEFSGFAVFLRRIARPRAGNRTYGKPAHPAPTPCGQKPWPVPEYPGSLQPEPGGPEGLLYLLQGSQGPGGAPSARLPGSGPAQRPQRRGVRPGATSGQARGPGYCSSTAGRATPSAGATSSASSGRPASMSSPSTPRPTGIPAGAFSMFPSIPNAWNTWCGLMSPGISSGTRWGA